MDESVVKHLEQQQITKLAQAIRRGHDMINEATGYYLLDSSGCAIGAAWVGMGLSQDDFSVAWARDEKKAIAKELGITFDLFLRISSMHQAGMPRLQIANWLDNGGSRTC